MHLFDLPEPLSDKSTFVNLDLAVLSDLSLAKHLSPNPNHELVLWSNHLLIRVFYEFPLPFCFLLLFPGESIVCCRSLGSGGMYVPRYRLRYIHLHLQGNRVPAVVRTPTHSPRRFSRRPLGLSAETFATLLLAHMCAPIDSSSTMKSLAEDCR